VQAGADAICREVASTYSKYAAAYAGATRDYARFPGLEGELLSFLGRLPAGSVLDLGAGSGRDTEFAAQRGFGVVAADCALGMAQEIKRQLPAAAVVCCDARRLPFRTASFAGLIASGVLLHLPKDACGSALSEVQRVLLPAGSALVSMRAGEGQGWREGKSLAERRWFSLYQPEEFKRLCLGAGLVVDAERSCPREDWFSLVLRPA
jgi:tRNA (uracil-5-)-methyltransferase TRM9